MFQISRKSDDLSHSSSNFIEDISFVEKIKFWFLSLFWSLVLLCKLGGLWMWNSKKYFITKQRDKPPRCLIDSSLGQHSYIKLKGAKLHYVESGCSDHPLLFLLHGFLDCWIGWRHQIPALAPHFRVIAVDLRGFGDSEKPVSHRKYGVHELVQELADFINVLGGGESCIIIGHDIGALLGWFLLHKHPQLVKRFISISCPHPNIFWDKLLPTALFNLRFIYECQFPWLVETRMMQQDLNILDQYLSHLPAQSSATGVVSRETYKYVFSRRVDWRGALNYYRNIWISRLSETREPSKVPLLLLMGDGDGNCTLEAAIQSTEQEEKLSIRVINGTGHFPHQEAPAKVNHLLLNFLAVPEGRVGCTSSSPPMQQKGLVNRMFGALSSTVHYGNQVLESVTKRSSLDSNSHSFFNDVSIPR